MSVNASIFVMRSKNIVGKLNLHFNAKYFVRVFPLKLIYVDFNSKNGRAIIIFDVMGFVHNFHGSDIDFKLGGRQCIYLLQFHQFLTQLKSAGATMVFFWDGQLQPSRCVEWCQRREKEFNTSSQKGCKTISKSLRKLIEDEEFGRVVISTQVECDAAIAKYAVENRALAVIASDSDFLIFDGDFQLWSSNSIQMERMEVEQFHHQNLRQLFRLTNVQMKYLATIAGNDYTKSLVKGRRIDFIKIADFCRSIRSNETERSIYQKIKNYMGLRYETTAITTSIQSYDINFADEPPTDQMSKYFSSNVLMYAFKHRQIFQYEINFLDFQLRNHNNLPYLDTLLVVFRKLGGIILKTDADQQPVLKIVTKYSMNENYMEKEHQPIYPQGTTIILSVLQNFKFFIIIRSSGN